MTGIASEHYKSHHFCTRIKYMRRLHLWSTNREHNSDICFVDLGKRFRIIRQLLQSASMQVRTEIHKFTSLIFIDIPKSHV